MSRFSIAVRLFVITAVAAVCLACANSLTKDIITENQEKTFNENLSKALPSAKVFKPGDFAPYDDETVSIKSVNEGYSDEKQENLEGFVVEVSSMEGYGGEVGVMVGIDKDYNVTKVIISSPFSETPGLGAKAKNPEFIDQFKGKSGDIKVVKGEASGDDEISAISSATITSKAVTKCVNAAVETVQKSSGKMSQNAQKLKDVSSEKEEKSKNEKSEIDEKRKDEAKPQIPELDDEKEDKDE